MIQASVRVRTFVTLTIAVVERSPGRLRVASAGHPPTFLRRASDGAVIEVGLPAPPLGTRLPTRYEEQTVDLAAGDLVLLYTDGLVEATDFRTEAYGFGRLERAFGRAASGSPRTGRARAIRTLILEDVSHFKGENYQADDLSLVVVRFDPGPEAHVPREALEAAPPAAGSSEGVPLGEATDPRSSGSDG
jgi:serine phosphatase RsbU (regulator of sigma subunit)